MLLRPLRVVLLEASDKVLMAFDGDLQEAALQKQRSDEQGIAIEVRLSAGVREVTKERSGSFLMITGMMNDQ